jgi:hypothetical protein
MAKFSSPFSFLWQALFLPSKNPKLFFQIFLISVISHGLLCNNLQKSTAPVLSKLNETAKVLPTNDTSTAESTELWNTFNAGIKKLYTYCIVFTIFTSVNSSLLSIITYYATSTTYLGEIILTLRELGNKVKGITKGPLITQLFLELFSTVYVHIITKIVFTISWNVSTDYKISIWLVLTPLGLLATLLFVYLVVIWSMGVAISFIEPNLYGIGAILHMARLLKGKKMQMFFLIVAAPIVDGIKYLCNPKILKFVFGSESKSSMVRVFMAQLLPQLIALYTRMVITVLCFECNQINADAGNKIEYTKLPLLE